MHAQLARLLPDGHTLQKKVWHIAVVPQQQFRSFEFEPGICLRDGHLRKESVSIEYFVCYLKGLLE
jgi:hypothetical protein